MTQGVAAQWDGAGVLVKQGKRWKSSTRSSRTFRKQAQGRVEGSTPKVWGRFPGPGVISCGL